MIPRFFVAKRPQWWARFTGYPFAICADCEGVHKVVAITHEAEVGAMVADGLNQWGELDQQLKGIRGKGPRIVTLD